MADKLSPLTLAAAKTYTNKSIEGAGAIAGKSAYEIAVENGFVGTEEEWLESLHGEDGKDGKDGVDGVGVPEGGTTGQILKKASNDDYDTEWGDGGSGSGALETAITASTNVGGIKSGDNFPVGTSYDEMWQDLIDPIAYPSLTAPSATIAVSGSTLLETGATTEKTFTVTFNRGSISPAYGTSGYRSGAAESYSLNGGEAQEENTFTETVSSENKTFQATVAYGAGEQPKDSKGNDYSTPLAAGSVNTNTISYEFVDAIWANTSSIATIAKLALVSKSAKQKDLNFPSQTVANPEVFDIPASWTVTAVQVKNDLSGAYEDALSQFTVTDTTHNDAAGNSVAYKRYTFNLGYPTGARSVRVKWS